MVIPLPSSQGRDKYPTSIAPTVGTSCSNTFPISHWTSSPLTKIELWVERAAIFSPRITRRLSYRLPRLPRSSLPRAEFLPVWQDYQVNLNSIRLVQLRIQYEPTNIKDRVRSSAAVTLALFYKLSSLPHSSCPCSPNIFAYF